MWFGWLVAMCERGKQQPGHTLGIRDRILLITGIVYYCFLFLMVSGPQDHFSVTTPTACDPSVSDFFSRTAFMCFLPSPCFGAYKATTVLFEPNSCSGSSYPPLSHPPSLSSRVASLPLPPSASSSISRLEPADRDDERCPSCRNLRCTPA